MTSVFYPTFKNGLLATFRNDSTYVTPPLDTLAEIILLQIRNLQMHKKLWSPLNCLRKTGFRGCHPLSLIIPRPPGGVILCVFDAIGVIITILYGNRTVLVTRCFSDLSASILLNAFDLLCSWCTVSFLIGFRNLWGGRFVVGLLSGFVYEIYYINNYNMHPRT